jgi:hypothetical protein
LSIEFVIPSAVAVINAVATVLIVSATIGSPFLVIAVLVLLQIVSLRILSRNSYPSLERLPTQYALPLKVAIFFTS